jgi:hypothetical protein
VAETTSQPAESKEAKDAKPKEPRAPRDRRERGPPADGIPSKNKVMVANLPYDLSEEKVCSNSSNSLAAAYFVLAQGTLRCL